MQSKANAKQRERRNMCQLELVFKLLRNICQHKFVCLVSGFVCLFVCLFVCSLSLSLSLSLFGLSSARLKNKTLDWGRAGMMFWFGYLFQDVQT